MDSVAGIDAPWTVIAPLLMVVPRILAATTIAPLFPASLFPRLLRNTIAVSLALCLYPHIAINMPPRTLAPLLWLALIGKEVLIGMLIGVAVGTLIWVFESIGALVDAQVGLVNGLLFDPFGGHEGGPTTAFMAQLAVALFVVGGGLYVFVSLLFESFLLWPLASFYPALGERFADFGIESLTSVAQLTVRLAAPVILLLVLVDLTFGLVNRVVPQLNVFFFTMPLKGALAALMIAVYLSYLVDVAIGHIDGLRALLERLAQALSGN